VRGVGEDEAAILLEQEREQARQIARIRETEKQHANAKLQEKLNKKKQVRASHQSFHETSDILEPCAIKINSAADSSRSLFGASFTVLHCYTLTFNDVDFFS
jgi:hypothetical protein